MIAGFEMPDDGAHPPARARTSPTRLAEPAAGQHGLPAVRALPAHVDLRQRRLRAQGEAASRAASTASRVLEMLRDRRARGPRAAPPAAALGRPAAARRPGARARQPAGSAAARRAARRARREAAQADAARAEADPARARHDVRLRHARPGGGAGDVRPDRRHERRAASSRSGARARSTSSPQTAFVADFIGSLNALELRVDELVGGYAVMRLGEGERSCRRRSSADHPERGLVPGRGSSGAHSDRAGRRARLPKEDRGSEGSDRRGRLSSGMYTQFHVDTGRRPRSSSTGSPTSDLAVSQSAPASLLTWEPEQTLDARRAPRRLRRLGVCRSEPPFGRRAVLPLRRRRRSGRR